MERFERATEELRQRTARYLSLKKVFNEFQKHIEEAGAQTFVVKGITVTSTSPTRSDLEYLDQRFAVTFSMVNGAGVLTFSRIVGVEDVLTTIDAVTFNGQGVADVQGPPPLQDNPNLHEDINCLTLLLNWLCVA